MKKRNLYTLFASDPQGLAESWEIIDAQYIYAYSLSLSGLVEM